jgi:hypothetical protein
MPTTPVATFGAGRVDPLKSPDECIVEVVGLKASTTFAAGTLIGEITASPGTYGPYATGNVDGTQNPTHILMYACITDASGNVTLGSSVAAGAKAYMNRTTFNSLLSNTNANDWSASMPVP